MSIREVKSQRRFPWSTFIWVLVLLGVVSGIVSFATHRSLEEFERELGGIVAFSWVLACAEELLAPFYREFRFRTLEIDGKLSAIEELIIASKKEHAELLQRLATIEDKLDSIHQTTPN